MAFAHELSWSVSRDGTFRSCRRRYYYDYYLAWNGWDRAAPAERQRVYLLKKMTRMPMLAGDALHRALQDWFEARRRGSRLDPASVEERAVTLLREGYRTSRDGAWRRKPSKLTRLAEHHYAEPCIDEASGAAGDYGKRYVERIRAGVRAFFEMPALEHVRAAEPASWLACEQMGTIQLHDTKIYAVPDFAYREERDGRSLVHIYDWKSGKPRDVDRFQLAIYTIYAGQVWGAAPEDVVCYDAYLPSGEIALARHTAAELEPALAHVERSLSEMRALHFDATDDAGDPERFPPLADEGDRECRTCNYRELCGRHA